MCFKLCETQTPWKRRIVYKVLKQTKGGRLKAPFRTSIVLYRLGHIKRRDKGETTVLASCRRQILADGSRREIVKSKAKHGIYVYDRLSIAKAQAKSQNPLPGVYSPNKFVVVRCEVDPADFIAHSEWTTVTNYTKLKRRRRAPAGTGGLGSHYRWTTVGGAQATYQKIKPLEIVS